MIRLATVSDKPRVLRMARDFHTASGTSLPFSAVMADAVFNACLQDADRACFVMDVDGQARGVLAAQAGLHHFSPVRIATEIIWWVDPDYRGIEALRMLRSYEDWARARGCAYAAMIGLGEDPVVGRTYQQRGYVPAERHFLKAL